MFDSSTHTRLHAQMVSNHQWGGSECNYCGGESVHETHTVKQLRWVNIGWVSGERARRRSTDM